VGNVDEDEEASGEVVFVSSAVLLGSIWSAMTAVRFGRVKRGFLNETQGLLIDLTWRPRCKKVPGKARGFSQVNANGIKRETLSYPTLALSCLGTKTFVTCVVQGGLYAEVVDKISW